MSGILTVRPVDRDRIGYPIVFDPAAECASSDAQVLRDRMVIDQVIHRFFPECSLSGVKCQSFVPCRLGVIELPPDLP